MADTKVKISHILDSQIPDFIHDENPLFKEFLNQYYISQEHEYGNIDIAENITDVKNRYGIHFNNYAISFLHPVTTISKNINDKISQIYFQSLKEINNKLWDIENEKRLCEKNSDFGEVFIKTSRDIHFLNDERAKIKLEINNYTGSKIKEIKEYTKY